MIRRFYIILCLVFLASCDDGDIITIDLEFDEELERCDNFEDSYLIYDTREDPNEALILVIPKPASDYLFTTATETPVQLTIPSEAQFYYRTYNKALEGDVLCNILSDPDLVVLENNPAEAGLVEVTVTLVDDDNDGIPSADEGQDPNGDGDFSDAQDSDLDGIPDYLDEDDDNDNVKTINEDDNDDGDNNPFTNARNTDSASGDSVPDYLDDDDDGDGVDTRLEDEDENENPINDFQESTDGSTVPPRFLDINATEAFPDSGFIDNRYTRTVTTVFVISNTGIGPVSSTEIQFGTYVSDPINFDTVNDD